MDAVLLELARQQSSICKLFSNPNRILILWTLVEQEHSVGEIAEAIEASMQNTSQHLRLMQERGIVQSRRNGNTIFYRLVRESLHDCRLLLIANNRISSHEGAKQNDEH